MLEILENRCTPAAGALDTSFSGDGEQTVNVGADDFATDVAVQADGKILQVGRSLNAGLNDFAVVRYNVNGTLDTSFGGGDGIFSFDFGGQDSQCSAVEVLSDGKILMFGSTGAGTAKSWALARLTSAGALDTTFSTDGRITYDPSVGIDLGNDVIVQSDGNILLLGSARPGADGDWAIQRVSSAGVADATFNGGNPLVFDFSGQDDVPRRMKLDSFNRIVIAGVAKDSAGINRFGVARVTAAGALDTAFSGDGRTTLSITGQDDDANALLIDNNSKIVVAGEINNGANDDMAVARFNFNGSLDTSFDGDGIAILNAANNAESARAIAQDNVGSYVLAGAQGSELAVGRLLNNGAPDVSLGGDGIAVSSFSPTVVGVGGVLTSQGMIVFGQTFTAPRDFVISRFLLNNDPIARNDTAITNEESAVDIDVLFNDSLAGDPGETLSVNGNSQGANGSVANLGGGVLRYTPNANFFGTDTFTYTLSDGNGNGGTDIGTVTVTVNPVNDTPVNTIPGTQSVVQNGALTLSNVLSIDDVDGGVMFCKLASNRGNLTVKVDHNGAVLNNGTFGVTIIGNENEINLALRQVEFRPFTGLVGIPATVTLFTNDMGTTGSGGFRTDNDSFTINITAAGAPSPRIVKPNHAPVTNGLLAEATTFRTIMNQTLTVFAWKGLRRGFYDRDGNPLMFEVVKQPTSGTLSLWSTGSFTYKPAKDFRGRATFVVRAFDGRAYSPDVTVTIDVL